MITLWRFDSTLHQLSPNVVLWKSCDGRKNKMLQILWQYHISIYFLWCTKCFRILVWGYISNILTQVYTYDYIYIIKKAKTKVRNLNKQNVISIQKTWETIILCYVYEAYIKKRKHRRYVYIALCWCSLLWTWFLT